MHTTTFYNFKINSKYDHGLMRRVFDNFWVVTNTNSKLTIELLKDFKQFVVMVLQPHNSKLTIELLQDF